MTRKPVVAGTFYPDDSGELDKQIKGCFKSKFGPGDIPADRRDKKIIGVIAPHAGYAFSGAGQAWCYKEIGEAHFPDVYVILGTAHSGLEGAAVVIDDFETPYGAVETDEKFAKSLMEMGAVVEDKIAHQQEHSVEVQLPFLQFVNKDKIKQIKIVPVVVGQKADYEALGKAIVLVSKELGKNIILICSSDFTHHGISYGYMPFRRNIGESVKKLDMGAIKWIKEMDSWSFVNYVEESNATICGAYAIAASIEACNALGASNARLEQYYTSGEVTGDFDNCVGYASIIVE